MKKVLIIEPGYAEYSNELNVLSKFDVKLMIAPLGIDRNSLFEKAKLADAILVREAKIDEELISNLSSCKVIVRYGVGVDNINLEAAKAKGIYVANVPDYGSEDVAEHAFALMLSAARRIPSRNKAVRNGVWGVGQAEPMFRLKNKVLGIVGFGRIARCLAHKASGLDFNSVLVYDPYLSHEEAEKYHVRKCELKDLFSESDYISLHLPLNNETRHIVGADLLKIMKKTAILINTGRGGLVDENALYDALANNKIFAAALDVFEKEPVNHDSPLLGLDNVITTDHTAWFTEESVIELQQKAAMEIARVFEGQQPKHWLNK